jgi:hypothetical protein
MVSSRAPLVIVRLAEALASVGCFQAAFIAIEQALSYRRDAESAFDLSEMLRIKAQVLLGVSTENYAAAVEHRECF